ncbi:hypothetical protein [Nitrososphaera viennensis]|uniref:Uncharacterized protein n=2 Tax=Nitrososphaera viennensis TaxID=1034015 RepID=A0A060HMU5_9ARCH|nr:hypothetical protein [Nitrososphaera viennensis]AIC16813.1 hypothetical protein NVIE_025430 [Nitrososphaera viennensis EN76]UVS68719.1 hypothetical protein NWT39_12535 [Nitrososphaera viennensis]
MKARQQQKTVTRTIRLPGSLDSVLQKDAKEKRTTVNSLISSIITRYAEWDRYADAFGFICLPRNGFKLILDALGDETVRQIAETIGSRQPRELMMFVFKKTTLDAFLSQISLFSRYAGFGTYEIEAVSERDYTMVVHHELGRKWSIYLAHLGSQGLKSTVNVAPKVHIAENSVVFKFSVP